MSKQAGRAKGPIGETYIGQVRQAGHYAQRYPMLYVRLGSKFEVGDSVRVTVELLRREPRK